MVCAMAAALLSACEKNASDGEVSNMEKTQEVRLSFTPYDVSPMTRAATSISNYCTRLDVWISDGTTTTAVI